MFKVFTFLVVYSLVFATTDSLSAAADKPSMIQKCQEHLLNQEEQDALAEEIALQEEMLQKAKIALQANQQKDAIPFRESPAHTKKQQVQEKPALVSEPTKNSIKRVSLLGALTIALGFSGNHIFHAMEYERVNGEWILESTVSDDVFYGLAQLQNEVNANDSLTELDLLKKSKPLLKDFEGKRYIGIGNRMFFEKVLFQIYQISADYSLKHDLSLAEYENLKSKMLAPLQDDVDFRQMLEEAHDSVQWYLSYKAVHRRIDSIYQEVQVETLPLKVAKIAENDMNKFLHPSRVAEQGNPYFDPNVGVAEILQEMKRLKDLLQVFQVELKGSPERINSNFETHSFRTKYQKMLEMLRDRAIKNKVNLLENEGMSILELYSL